MNEKLAAALEKEKAMLISKRVSTFDHELTIKYLRTGSKPANWNTYDILSAAVGDFDSLCHDYGIK